MRNWLKLSDYNAICDSCGRKFKASSLKMRWDGLFVCKEDYEIKHPQLSLRVFGDKQTVPIARPETVDTFIPVYYLCYGDGTTAFSGRAMAGCSISGRTQGIIWVSRKAIAGIGIAGLALSGTSI